MEWSPDRLAALRAQFDEYQIDAYIVPRTDRFQSEYPAICDLRLDWLTGFTGSAGFALIGREEACVFSDGRYAEQLPQQIDQDHLSYEILETGFTYKNAYKNWFASHLDKGEVVGYDPWLTTIEDVKFFREVKGIKFKAIATNLVDAIWLNRPPFPDAAVEMHPLAYAGQSHGEKIQMVAQWLQKKKAQYVVITLADSIAWLLNIRGADINYNPLVLSYVVVNESGQVDWYVGKNKVSDAVKNILGKTVHVHDLYRFEEDLSKKSSVVIDKDSCPSAIRDHLKEAGADIKFANDPCQLPKAVKNEAEINGARAAHIRDAVANIHFYKWLSEQNVVDESKIDTALMGFRSKLEHYKGDSFASIVGAGENGAIIHYRSTDATNRTLETDELLLVDSGGQYLDGTTDITRTIVNGQPTEEQRDRYTRVLKGHIAVASAVFPVGTTGHELDSLARQYLLKIGCNYNHGTGHGIGSYLCVHEGPQRISRRGGDTPLEPGMLLSNEPGFYKSGEYGIRLENVILVVEHMTDKNMLCFETLTLVPFDHRLIKAEMLSRDEVEWLNAYQEKIWDTMSQHLDEEHQTWLKSQLLPL